MMIHTARTNGTKPSQVEAELWNDTGIGTVNLKTNAVPSSIYPTLKISPGEVKIIAEAIMLGNSAAYPDVNGRLLSVKQMFGFYLLSPKGHKAPTNSNYGYFNSVVIFSPKPGLFSETAPK